MKLKEMVKVQQRFNEWC